MVSPWRSGAAKEISSSTRSITVCNRRAPIFSTVELTATATSASASMALSVISSVTPSVCISATYCLISDASRSVRMRRRSSRVSASSSTRIGIQQLVGFLGDQKLVGILYRQAAGLGPSTQFAEDIADRDCAHLGAGHAGNFKHRHSARGLRLDLDFLVVEFAGAQFLAERIARRGAGVGADQGIEHTILGGELRAGLHVLALAFPGLRDRDFD